jgi:hypothetical protein
MVGFRRGRQVSIGTNIRGIGAEGEEFRVGYGHVPEKCPLKDAHLLFLVFLPTGQAEDRVALGQ